MSANLPNLKNSNDTTDMQENSLEKNQQLQYLLFRLFPFWPLIALSLIMGYTTGYILLRYATPVYQVKTRIIINDDSQEKSANLQEIIKIDTRNLTAETEKEIETIRSLDLLKKVVSKLQLNVAYSGKGNIKTGQLYKNLPATLELADPNLILTYTSGEAKIVGKQVNFNGVLYTADSFINSSFGKIRWHINEDLINRIPNGKFIVAIMPVATMARQLKAALSVAPISKQSSILDITYVDVFTDRAALILNTLIEMYGISLLDYKSRIYDNTQKFLDGRLGLIANELTGVEKRLQDYKTSQRITDLGTEGSLYLNKIRTSDTKIGELDVQLEVLVEVEKYVNSRNKNSNAVPATLGISDVVLNSLLNQLYQAEFELEGIKQISGEKNPRIEVLEQMIAKLKPSVLVSINNLKINLQASRKQLEADNASIASTINAIPAKERTLLDISRQQGIKNAIYTFLLQKKEESAIAAASIVSNFRVLERPEGGTLIAPNRQNYFAISIVVFLLIAVLYIYLKEFANSRLLFRSQIESRLAIPIVGELVFKPSSTGSPVVVGEGLRTLISEQFRELRTNLSFAAAASTNREKGKTILVTSSIPNEGKSFVAINTAVSLCLTGARVVLLEFDLRKPKISKPLGIKREPGITNFLIGNASVTDIIQQHPTIPNFNIISSGPVPPNPAELIGGPNMAGLMDYLKKNFDYVLLDSPPMASVTDAKLLAIHADLTLYIIRHNFTNSVFLKMINDVHQKNTMPNMNIVFNAIVNKKVLGYGYGKGYGYGYGYAYGYGYGYGYTVEAQEQPWWKKMISKVFKT